MILHTTADKVTVRSDEQGYELFIETDEGDNITVNIQSIVFDFYAAVQREVRPYVLEAESARTGPRPVDISGYRDDGEREFGYALDDPKHPTYHDRMSGIHDSREGE